MSPVLVLAFWGITGYAGWACIGIIVAYWFAAKVILQEKKAQLNFLFMLLIISFSMVIVGVDFLWKTGLMNPSLNPDVRRLGELKVAMFINAYMILMGLLCLRLRDKEREQHRDQTVH